MRHRAVVIGAGVIGLTTACCLVEDGWDVELLTAEPTPRTTSAVAAAVWFPYLVGPADAVARWGRRTAEELARLATDPSVPVTARSLHELRRTTDEPVGWRARMPGFAAVTELPDWAVQGWRYTTWTADMPRYLAWLRGRLGDVPVRQVHLATLADAFAADERPGAGPADLVVDCAGVGARALADDPTVTPVRGQVVLVEAPGVTDVWLDPDGPHGATYVIPRDGGVVVVGGTADHGVWDRTTDDAVTADVLRRGAALVPAVADAPVLDVAVGLRRHGRRSGSSSSGPQQVRCCTTTATVAPVSRCPGAALVTPPTWHERRSSSEPAACTRPWSPHETVLLARFPASGEATNAAIVPAKHETVPLARFRDAAGVWAQGRRKPMAS